MYFLEYHVVGLFGIKLNLVCYNPEVWKKSVFRILQGLKRWTLSLSQSNNNEDKFQIIVSTHSPYILSSFNNLFEAGRLNILKPDRAKDIAEIVPVAAQIKPGLLTAYSINNGKKENLIDEETNLIIETVLDNVSNDIAIEFGKLLDIEF